MLAIRLVACELDCGIPIDRLSKCHEMEDNEEDEHEDGMKSKVKRGRTRTLRRLMERGKSMQTVW